jgi:hypothetical protein
MMKVMTELFTKN